MDHDRLAEQAVAISEMLGRAGVGACPIEEGVRRIIERPMVPVSALRALNRRFPIQDVGMIPLSVAERAYTRYAQLYGRSQTLERLAERGGFGLAELGFLLRGYEKCDDSNEDDGDWKRACEFATKEILKAIAQELAALCDAAEGKP